MCKTDNTFGSAYEALSRKPDDNEESSKTTGNPRKRGMKDDNDFLFESGKNAKAKAAEGKGAIVKNEFGDTAVCS